MTLLWEEPLLKILAAERDVLPIAATLAYIGEAGEEISEAGGQSSGAAAQTVRSKRAIVRSRRPGSGGGRSDFRRRCGVPGSLPNPNPTRKEGQNHKNFPGGKSDGRKIEA